MIFLGYRGLWGLRPFPRCDVMWWYGYWCFGLRSSPSTSTSLLSRRSEPKIGWSGEERWAGVAENDGALKERGAGGCGAGTERGAGVCKNRLERGAAFKRFFAARRARHGTHTLGSQTVLFCLLISDLSACYCFRRFRSELFTFAVWISGVLWFVGSF